MVAALSGRGEGGSVIERIALRRLQQVKATLPPAGNESAAEWLDKNWPAWRKMPGASSVVSAQNDEQ